MRSMTLICLIVTALISSISAELRYTMHQITSSGRVSDVLASSLEMHTIGVQQNVLLDTTTRSLLKAQYNLLNNRLHRPHYQKLPFNMRSFSSIDAAGAGPDGDAYDEWEEDPQDLFFFLKPSPAANVERLSHRQPVENIVSMTVSPSGDVGGSNTDGPEAAIDEANSRAGREISDVQRGSGESSMDVTNASAWALMLRRHDALVSAPLATALKTQRHRQRQMSVRQKGAQGGSGGGVEDGCVGLGLYQGVMVRARGVHSEDKREGSAQSGLEHGAEEELEPEGGIDRDMGHVAAWVCGGRVEGVVMRGERVWSIDSDGDDGQDDGVSGGQEEGDARASVGVRVSMREVDISGIGCASHTLLNPYAHTHAHADAHAHTHTDTPSEGERSHMSDRQPSLAPRIFPMDILPPLPFPFSLLFPSPRAAAAPSMHSSTHSAADGVAVRADGAETEEPLVFELMLVSDRHRTSLYANNTELVRTALLAANVADVLYSRAALQPPARVLVVGMRGLKEPASAVTPSNHSTNNTTNTTTGDARGHTTGTAVGADGSGAAATATGDPASEGTRAAVDAAADGDGGVDKDTEHDTDANDDTVGGHPLMDQLFEARLGPEVVPTVADAEEYLIQGFLPWARTHLPSTDVPVLLTGLALRGSVVGMATVNTACTSRAGAVIQAPFGSNVAITGIALAHEGLHVAGLPHDEDIPSVTTTDGSGATTTCPQDGGFLMSARTRATSTVWSDCSRVLWGNAARGDGLPCLRVAGGAAYTEGECGNGVVEPGEQCDCGAADCTGVDPCCDGRSCRLVLGAECTSSQPCCQQCRVAGARGRVCRAARHGVCDAEEVCDGVNAECPEDTWVHDGYWCRAGAEAGVGRCWHGACRSAAAVCVGLRASACSGRQAMGEEVCLSAWCSGGDGAAANSVAAREHAVRTQSIPAAWLHGSGSATAIGRRTSLHESEVEGSADVEESAGENGEESAGAEECWDAVERVQGVSADAAATLLDGVPCGADGQCQSGACVLGAGTGEPAEEWSGVWGLGRKESALAVAVLVALVCVNGAFVVRVLCCSAANADSEVVAATLHSQRSAPYASAARGSAAGGAERPPPKASSQRRRASKRERTDASLSMPDATEQDRGQGQEAGSWEQFAQERLGREAEEKQAEV